MTDADDAAIQRRLRSAPAIGPAVIAAVMAARLIACPPNGAPSEGADPGHGHRLAPRHGVAVARHHRDARHVLRGHRHDVERDRDADHGRDGPVRRGPGERSGPGRPASTDGAGRHDDHGQGDRERDRHRPAPRDPVHDQPGEHDRSDVRRGVREPGHRREADRQQHAGEHRAGERGRDPGDQVAEPGKQAGEQDQRRGDDEGADRGRPAAGDGAGRDQERRARASTRRA